MESKPFISIESVGTHTARYNSLTKVVLDGFCKNMAIYVLGNKLVLCDVQSQKAICHQKVMEDSIMVVKQLYGQNMFVCCSYDAHFVTFTLGDDCKSIQVLRSYESHIEKIRYVRQLAIVDDKTIAFVAEEGISRDEKPKAEKDKDIQLKQSTVYEDEAENKVIVCSLEQDEIQILGQQDGPYILVESCMSDEKKAVYAVKMFEDEQFTSIIGVLVDPVNGAILKEQILGKYPKDARVVASDLVLNPEANLLIMCLTNKSFIVHDPNDFESFKEIRFPGSNMTKLGSPSVIGAEFISMIDNGKMVRISKDVFGNEKQELEVTDQTQGVTVVDLLNKNGSKVSGDYISWVAHQNDDELCFVQATHDGLKYISQNNSTTDDSFGITCCGASISNDQKTTLVGDFLGSVRVAKDGVIVNAIFIGGPIRYIHFHDFITNLVFVSGMDGNLHAILLSDEGELVQMETIHSAGNTITNIRTARVKDKPEEFYLIFGDTKGFVYLMHSVKDDLKSFKLLLKHEAHQPSTGPYDNKFGSLQKFSEIWSTCTNPQQDPDSHLTHICTSSEDQTCKVFEVHFGDGEPSLKLVHTLTGHTLAVTSIDWKGDLLMTCSDDKTVRLYRNFELCHILNTLFISCWHTLTYAHLGQIGDMFRVTAVSENGYIFVWHVPKGDLQQSEVQYARKIHNGSIEALAIRDSKGVTCASDQSFSVIEFNQFVQNAKI